MLLYHSNFTLPENITLHQSKAWHTAIVSDHIDHQLVGCVSREILSRLILWPAATVHRFSGCHLYTIFVIFLHPFYHALKLHQNTKRDIEDNQINNYLHGAESWEAAVTLEIPCLLWNLKVDYCVHKSPALVLNLNQIHPVHILRPPFISIIVNYNHLIIWIQWYTYYKWMRNRNKVFGWKIWSEETTKAQKWEYQNDLNETVWGLGLDSYESGLASSGNILWTP
jgi:hypothetical protein